MRAPTEAVKERFFVSDRQASNYVKKARRPDCYRGPLRERRRVDRWQALIRLSSRWSPGATGRRGRSRCRAPVGGLGAHPMERAGRSASRPGGSRGAPRQRRALEARRHLRRHVGGQGDVQGLRRRMASDAGAPCTRPKCRRSPTFVCMSIRGSGDGLSRSVRPSEVQALVKAASGDLAASTVEVVYRLVAAVFLAAVDDRLIAETPCRNISLPRQERKRVVPLTAEQVRALESGLPGRLRALVTLGAGTGLRQGEAFGLTVDRVDFLRRSITVDRQITLVRGAPWFLPPKTASSYRGRSGPPGGARRLVGAPCRIWAG